MKPALKLITLVLAVLTAHSAAPFPAAAASVSQLVPHKALYRLSLKGSSGTNDVSAVGGQMAFEWRDTCDGWAINQRNLMLLESAEGVMRSVDSRMTTWEAKDGSSFRFIVDKDYGAGGGEIVEGRAQRTETGAVTARFTSPSEVAMDLPADVMFPSQHTLALLDSIAAGEKFFAATLLTARNSSRQGLSPPP